MSTGGLPSWSMTRNATTSPSRVPPPLGLGTTPARGACVPPDLALRQRGHGESWMFTAWPYTWRRAVVLEGETLQRSVSVEYSLVKAERLSPYESLWVDSPDALAVSAGSAATSI